jgi:hypothetical protein
MHAMKSIFARYILAAASVAFCSTLGAFAAGEEAPPFDVAEWLSMPDHMDFPWKVYLTTKISRVDLQQRYMAGVHAYIDCGDLRDSRNQRDLHFVLKVATSDNRWFPGYSYTHTAIPSGVDRSHEIHYMDRVYLRPGRYILALIVYDPALKQGNVYRRNVEVSRLKNDPLPKLDSTLPDVDFVGTDVWLLGQGKEWLPVKNSRCLCVDIIANTSIDDPYRQYSRPILQASSVLSHLVLHKGRVRVTILDALRMKTLCSREDATDFDWQRAIEIYRDQERAMIDVGTLESRTQASAYLFDQFQKILNDSACVPGVESPLKIVIVVGAGRLKFAEHTRVEQIIAQDPASDRFYYFSYTMESPDDLSKMLKGTKSRRLFFDDPFLFRKALAELISDLEKLK